MAELREHLRVLLHVRRPFLRRMVWFVVFLFAAWVLFGLVGDRVLLPIAQRQLAELTGGRVRIDSVEFTAYGMVRMNNLIIEPLEGRLYDNALLEAERVEGWFSVTSLLKFRPCLRSLRLKQFVINVEYDIDQDQWNLRTINLSGPDLSGPVPFVFADQGTLRLRRIRDGRIEPLVVLGVSGSFGPVSGQPDQFSYFLGVDDRLGFGGSELRGTLRVSQPGELSCLGRIRMGASPVFDNSWDIHDIDADLLLSQGKLEVRKLSCRVGPNSTLAISGTIGEFPRRPQLAVRVQLNDWTIDPQAHPDTLVYSEPIRQWLGGPLRQFLEQYQPRGRGDIDIDCTGPLLEPGKIQLSGVVRCRDIAVQYEKFPYRLEQTEGTIEVTQDSAVFDSLRARHGPVHLTLSGRFQSQGDKRQLRVTSENMLLDQDLYKAISEKQKALWFTFSPHGPARIDYRYQAEGEQPPNTRLEVGLNGTSAVYQHFPYPLRQLIGRVSIEKDRFILDDVVSKYDGRTIVLRGQITAIDTDRPRYQITVDANDIPIDSTLKGALTEKQREFFDNFEVDALTDVRVKIFPNEVGRRLVEYIASARIRGATMVFGKFPLPLTEVTAQADLTPDVVVLHSMTGRNGAGRVEVSGLIWPPNEIRTQPGYCLTIRAIDLSLDDRWLQALPPQAASVIEQIHPAGKVNVSASISADPGQSGCQPNRVEVECLGNEIRWPAFPYPIRNLTGRIIITPDRVEVGDIKADRIQISPKTLADFKGPARRILDALAVTGQIDIQVPKAVYVHPPSGPDSLDYSATIGFRQCELGKSGFVKGLSGTVQSSGSYTLGQGLTRCDGSVRTDAFTVAGRDLGRLSAEIAFDPDRGVFVSRDFRTDCHDGKILGNLELGTRGDDALGYRLELMFDSVVAAEILAQRLVGGQPSDASRAGRASGVFTLAGKLDRPDSSTGRLNMEIGELQLARQTVAGQVLSAAKLNEASDELFDRISVNAWVRNRQMVFDEVFMSGPRSLLKGAGSLDLQSGQVMLDFTVSPARGSKDPSFLQSLALALSSAIVKVEVRGPIDNPTVNSSPTTEP
jgi:hypothetical protein